MKAPKRKHVHHIVTRMAPDWTVGTVAGTFASRLAARRHVQSLSWARGIVVMILRDDQLRRAQRHGFVAFV